jgi:hypothetical protein
MRWLFILLLGWGLGVGCASRKAEAPREPSETFGASTKAINQRDGQKPSTPKTSPRPSRTLPASHFSTTNANAVLTVTDPVAGRVATVNPLLRYVVLDFSMKQVPTLEQRLNVYRQGQKVGEVKVTGPERGGNIVADLVAGEVKAGDEVRPD